MFEFDKDKSQSIFIHYQAVNMMFANSFFKVVGQQNLAGKRMRLKTRRHAIGEGRPDLLHLCNTAKKLIDMGGWIEKILHMC